MNTTAIYGLIALVAIVWSVRRWNAKRQNHGKVLSCLGFVGAVLLGFVIAIPFQIGAQFLFLTLGVGRVPAPTDRQQVSEYSVCLWLPKAQILVAKRISGASQFVEWFDKYGETGLEFSAATEELVTSIKEVQPYQRQFVDDWVKLGPHVDAEEAWEKELSSIQLRIQAFEEIIEGYESSNIDKYNHGLITWGESAQVGNEASSAMFEIVTRCTTSQMGLSPTPTVRMMATPTPRPEPSTTPTSSPSMPPLLVFDQTAWVYYKDQDTGFSAYYPENWERTVIPSEPDDPGRAVAFISPPESAGMEGNIVISVVSLPTLDFLGSTYPDGEELKQLFQESLEYAELEVIASPTVTEIHGYPAVQLVSETSLSDEDYRIRGYSVAIATDQWVHMIQVIGYTYYDDELQAMYTKFVENFTPNAP